MSQLPIVTRQAIELFDACYRTKNMIREFPKTYRFIEELWAQAASIRQTGMPKCPSLESDETERFEAVEALEEWAIAIAHGLECNTEEITTAVAKFVRELDRCETIETDEAIWKRGSSKVYDLAVKASNLVDRAEISLRRESKNGDLNGSATLLHFIERLQRALSGVLLIRSDDDKPAGFVCHPDVGETLKSILADPSLRTQTATPRTSIPRLDRGAPLEEQPGPHITTKRKNIRKASREVK